MGVQFGGMKSGVPTGYRSEKNSPAGIPGRRASMWDGKRSPREKGERAGKRPKLYPWVTLLLRDLGDEGNPALETERENPSRQSKPRSGTPR